jgi:hypothetical protein
MWPENLVARVEDADAISVHKFSVLVHSLDRLTYGYFCWQARCHKVHDRRGKGAAGLRHVQPVDGDDATLTVRRVKPMECAALQASYSRQASDEHS